MLALLNKLLPNVLPVKSRLAKVGVQRAAEVLGPASETETAVEAAVNVAVVNGAGRRQVPPN